MTRSLCTDATKAALSALVGLGMLTSTATMAKWASACRSAQIWRYALPSAKHSLPFVLLIIAIVDTVLDTHMNDIELKGEDVLEDVRACGRKLDGRKSAEEVDAGKGREPEGTKAVRNGGKGKVNGESQSEMTGRRGGTVCPRSTQGCPLNSPAQ